MVTTPIKPQWLSARDGDINVTDGQWGTMQIITPAIVGGALLLIFVAYIIWKRRPGRECSRAYDYRPVVHSGWATKIGCMFSPRSRRPQVHPSSMPTTLDDSMRLSGQGFMPDFCRTRPPRSSSTDSQELLRSSYVDNTPFKSHPDSPPPFSKRRGFRWWWIFGSRPRQVESAEPSKWWRVDGPGSSNGHGDTQPREALEAARREDQDEEDSVIQIGENLPSIASTPMTQHFPEQARAIRGMSPVPGHSGSSGTRTPLLAANVSRNNTGPPASQRQPDLPPSYDTSRSHTQYPSTEDVRTRSPRSDPRMVIPPPVRMAGHSSPRVLHGRELSSESVLATQHPMVATSIY